MRTRYFRYLFENQDNGLFHSGCIYDRSREKITNYIYMVGSHGATGKKHCEYGMQVDTIPEKVDILVVGGYTATYLNKLIAVVKRHEIETIILPYLAPIQRLMLVEQIRDFGAGRKESVRFLQDPYLYLKEAGIEKIFFLYKNGTTIGSEPEELPEGYYFAPADKEDLQLIREMEGCAIPVMKAGYIVENGWLFYFGVYGIDIQILSAFTREYFSHIENIHKVSENNDDDYVSQMKQLIREYTRRFGTSPETTIAMFEGPLNASPRENDSFMAQKEFGRREHCEAWMKQQGREYHSCVVKCMYCKDYDTMQHHKDKQEDESRFGMLMLGNLNLNNYYSELLSRFRKVRHRIRGIGIPNGGRRQEWNQQILSLSSDKNRMYWICGRNEHITSAEVVNDIVLSAQNNRFLSVDEKMGTCFSGYLIPKTEEEL